METVSAPQPAQQNIEQVKTADLIVGILADLPPENVAAICADLRTLAGSPRIVVLHHGDAASGAALPAESDDSLSLMPWSTLGADTPGTPLQSISAAYESIFAAAEKLGARGCCVVASRLEPANPRWICDLTAPLLDGKFDFVSPGYAHHRFEGLLNSSVISPLTRCLYGKRLQNPMGPDLGISRRLFEKMIVTDGNGSRVSHQLHPLASIAPVAVCANLPSCQVHLGSRTYPPPDWANVSSLISQALGPVFLDMERNAPCWQRTRGSAPVPSSGNSQAAQQETETLEIARMVESFQLGFRDLQEIWRLVLPPATLLEIGKLARLAPENFTMPDEVWVRIVFDFALGHRLRTINRDHLLRSLTPLYVGWAASFARQLGTGGAAAAQQRLERLSLAFEGNKPYLVSRWRWPDRFNP